MKKNHHRCRPCGFTLVELLTVMAVVVLLAAVALSTVTFLTRKAAVEKAEGQLLMLDHAMARYHADTGEYPVAVDPTGLVMYQVLFGDGVGADGIPGTADDGPLDGRPDAGATVYLDELNTETNPLGLLEGPKGGVPTRLVDPFGNSWYYGGGRENQPFLNNLNFDIHSPGPDGEGTPADPGADDFHNW